MIRIDIDETQVSTFACGGWIPFGPIGKILPPIWFGVFIYLCWMQDGMGSIYLLHCRTFAQSREESLNMYNDCF